MNSFKTWESLRTGTYALWLSNGLASLSGLTTQMRLMTDAGQIPFGAIAQLPLHIFGYTCFSLFLVDISLSIIHLLTIYWLCRAWFSHHAALFACLLFICAPYAFTTFDAAFLYCFINVNIFALWLCGLTIHLLSTQQTVPLKLGACFLLIAAAGTIFHISFIPFALANIFCLTIHFVNRAKHGALVYSAASLILVSALMFLLFSWAEGRISGELTAHNLATGGISSLRDIVFACVYNLKYFALDIFDSGKAGDIPWFKMLFPALFLFTLLERATDRQKNSPYVTEAVILTNVVTYFIFLNGMRFISNPHHFFPIIPFLAILVAGRLAALENPNATPRRQRAALLVFLILPLIYYAHGRSFQWTIDSDFLFRCPPYQTFQKPQYNAAVRNIISRDIIYGSTRVFAPYFGRRYSGPENSLQELLSPNLQPNKQVADQLFLEQLLCREELHPADIAAIGYYGYSRCPYKLTFLSVAQKITAPQAKKHALLAGIAHEAVLYHTWAESLRFVRETVPRFVQTPYQHHFYIIWGDRLRLHFKEHHESAFRFIEKNFPPRMQQYILYGYAAQGTAPALFLFSEQVPFVKKNFLILSDLIGNAYDHLEIINQLIRGNPTLPDGKKAFQHGFFYGLLTWGNVEFQTKEITFRPQDIAPGKIHPDCYKGFFQAIAYRFGEDKQLIDELNAQAAAVGVSP
ncbi:MAG: hypothetical protein NC924_02405 [Candidatus Omnitrophica bacterium]|nr:hypothetical protein [Candidatus Omnitrophota bacterium]